jgi:hypothetical protein
MRVAAAPAAGTRGLRRAALELLLLLDLGFLLLHVLAGGLESWQAGMSLRASVLATLDRPPFGLLAPLQLAGVAALLLTAAARQRSSAFMLAALGAGLLATGDLLAVPARIAVAMTQAAPATGIGLPSLPGWKLLAGGCLALVAAALIFPSAMAHDGSGITVARVLLASTALLAVADLLSEVALASGFNLDLPEEVLEAVLTAWPFSAALAGWDKSQIETKRWDASLLRHAGLRGKGPTAGTATR